MRREIWYVLGAAVLVGVLWFAYYTISPFFITTTADEALPGTIVENGMSASEASMPAMMRAVPVVDTPAHPASGEVHIVEADGKTYIRYENYKTLNGPDIYVYLAKDLDATEYVSLGRVKATEGNINYEVPEGVDVSEYRYALTWCKAFGVLFNYADLSLAR